jgi:hypothetical protein
MRILAFLSIAALVGGFVLALTGAGTLPGILLIVLGLILSLALGAIAATLRVRNAINEWRDLLSGGGPESVRVVGFEPPQGFLFRRDATIQLEVRGQDGTSKRIERGIPVPPPQAFLWRMAGRVPIPFRRLLADPQVFDLALYRKRKASSP